MRERVAPADPGTFVEDALLANREQDGFGADGVVTGTGAVAGRPVALMANDPTVKPGSWGPKTVEKIIRIQEQALAQRLPMVYLVDSAGAGSPTRCRCSRAAAARAHLPHRGEALGHPVPVYVLFRAERGRCGAYAAAFCDVGRSCATATSCTSARRAWPRW